MFFFSSFVFHKSENKRAEQILRGRGREGRVGTVEVGKRSRRVSMVKKMCTHACKCKNDNLLKLVHESGERG
jgi:hypothetical protein